VSLCLKNLGEATEADVRKFLKGCSLQAVRLVYDRSTGASRGIAFVDFTASEEVDKAMKKNGSELKGQAIEMRYEAPRSRPRPDGCMAVAVKKLSAEATQEDIRKLFNGLESLSDARVICDKDQACIGLAFAEFTDPADVEAAIRRDGMAVRGRTVFVCYETKSRKPRADGKDGKGAPAGKQGKAKAKKAKGEAAAKVAGAEGEEANEGEQPQAAKKNRKAKREAQREAAEGQREAEEAQEEVLQEAQPAAAAPLEGRPRKKRQKAEEAQEAEEEAAPAAEESAEGEPRKKPRKATAVEERAVADGEEDEGAAEADEDPEARTKKKKKRRRAEEE